MKDSQPEPRKLRRLPGYDYTQSGVYFVTIATSYHALTLGTVVEGEMHLSCAGKIVESAWIALPTRFLGLALDVSIVMPNHLHGLLVFPDQADRLAPFTVSDVIRSFKAASTRLIRTQTLATFAWQPNFHEHVVRNDLDLQRIREYIVNNPLRWSLDRANPSMANLLNHDGRS